VPSQREIKTFVKGEGGIDQYDCAIKYIPGHNPDLVLQDASSGEQIERIDLTKYKTQDELHGLLESRRVARKAAEAADDAPTGGEGPKAEL
jgi:hypothetical protein